MCYQSLILQEDLEKICSNEQIPWETLRGKSLLITGATGLLGTNLIHALHQADQKRELGLTVIALVRNRADAISRLSVQGWMPKLLEGSVESLPNLEASLDYIIHGASPTSSAYFVQHPVETVRTAVKGTWNLLELARKKSVSKFIYLSSMEVYGAHNTDVPIEENAPVYIDTMSVRNCYPEAKRLCENLCSSYWSEYQLPAVSIRLAQTFGTCVSKKDNRVFAQFAHAALNRENIILQTDGSTKSSYLYTADAVTAILTVLLLGQSGQAYNASNPATYCSILEMANLVAQELAHNQIQVKVCAGDNRTDCSLYPPPRRMNLCIDKLLGLGWSPQYNLQQMFERMIKDLLERGGF